MPFYFLGKNGIILCLTYFVTKIFPDAVGVWRRLLSYAPTCCNDLVERVVSPDLI